MKKLLLGLTLLLAMATSMFAQPPVLYFDFEGTTNKPAFSSGGATYNGVMANPLSDAVNSSDSVGMSTTGGNSWDGIIYKFDTPLDLSQGDDTVFTMLVYHPSLTGETRLQFDGNGMSSLKIDKQYTTPGAWMEITFPIPKTYHNKITQVMLVFAHDRTASGEEWYFDELRGPETMPPVGEVLYFDFEGDASTDPVFGESSAKFLGVVDNPHMDGMNSSDSVGLSETSGTADWDGITYLFDQPLDLSGDTIFTMLVYHPDSTGSTRLWFQGEAELKSNVQYDTPGSWQLLTWHIPSSYDGKFTKVTIVFDHNNGQAGGADGTDVEDWYFDELRGAPMLPPPPETEPRLYYSSVNMRQDFTGFSGATYEGVVDNPSPDAVNDNETTGKSLTGTVNYAGIFYYLPAAIDFSESQKFQLKVLSDSTGNVRIQLEKDGVSEKLKLSVPYTTPGQWEELTFDPATDNIGDPVMDDTWDKLGIIFDDGDSDDGEVWYFDDLYGPKIDSIGAVHVYANFEDVTPSPIYASTWAGANFGGVVDNPNPSGINTTDSVGLFFRGTVGYAGAYWDLPNYIDFNDGTIFTMWVYHPDSTGTVRIQLEKPGVVNTQCKMFADYTTPGAWQQLVFYADSGEWSGEVLPLRQDYYSRMLIVLGDNNGEEWYFDNIKGPALSQSYYTDMLFTVTDVANSAAAYSIDIDGSGTKMTLFDDGTNGDVTAADNVWSLLVPQVDVGDHLLDIYGDDVLLPGGNDFAFTVPDQLTTDTVVFYTNIQVLFKVETINTTQSGFSIDVNNSGTKTTLYDDGTNGDATADDGIWSVLMDGFPSGDYVWDIYGDDVLIPNGDDLAFTVPAAPDVVEVNYTYDATRINNNRSGSWSIYPNPTTANLNIISSTVLKSVKVYNMLGVEVLRLENVKTGKLVIPTSTLSSGVYMVKFRDVNGTEHITRIMKR